MLLEVNNRLNKDNYSDSHFESQRELNWSTYNKRGSPILHHGNILRSVTGDWLTLHKGILWNPFDTHCRMKELTLTLVRLLSAKWVSKWQVVSQHLCVQDDKPWCRLQRSNHTALFSLAELIVVNDKTNLESYALELFIDYRTSKEQFLILIWWTCHNFVFLQPFYVKNSLKVCYGAMSHKHVLQAVP